MIEPLAIESLVSFFNHHFSWQNPSGLSWQDLFRDQHQLWAKPESVPDDAHLL